MYKTILGKLYQERNIIFGFKVSILDLQDQVGPTSEVNLKETHSNLEEGIIRNRIQLIWYPKTNKFDLHQNQKKRISEG